MHQPMKRSALLGPLTVCLAVVSGAAASAGTVYVPLVKHEAGGRTFTTRVWVSNSGEVDRRFSAVFLPAFTNGTQGRAAADSRSVAGNQTLLLTNLSPAGVQGMLEITGAPQLAITAALETTGAGGAVTARAHVPVISSENLVKGGGTAALLGLERSQSGIVTNLGIANLAHRSQACTVRAFRANGQPIGASVRLTILPLSLSDFGDALGILGETSVTSARITVQCEADFYAFASVLDPAGVRATYVTPAQTADSALQAPGGTSNPPGNPPGSSPGTVTVQRPGAFFTPSRNDSYLAIDLPLETGKPYKRVVVEFDLFLRKWQSDFFHSITSLRRASARRDERILYYGLQLRGDNSKTTLDLGVHDVFVKGTGPWKPGGNYHLRLEYNLEAKVVSLQVSQNGAVVHTLQGAAQHLDLSSTTNPVRIDFGQDGIVPDSYYPPFGWTYSNLRATAEPR